MTLVKLLSAPVILTTALYLVTCAARPGLAQGTAPNIPRVTLPFNLVDKLDGAKFKIRVPVNWNGTLLVYIQGLKIGSTPPEPSLVPPVLPGLFVQLEDDLLSKGYALAASEIASTDWQTKASVQDHFALTAYFRGRIGEPKRVILWGTSNGGLASIRLMEDYPRSFDAAIATCPVAAGVPRNMDSKLDFALAYAVVFGWPDAWGSVGNLKPGLNFATDVAPKVNWPKDDSSNRGGWEFIRLVTGWDADAIWKTDPLLGYPGYYLQVLASTQNRANNEKWASGPIAQNLDHWYSLPADAKSYLAGLGIKPDDLLAKMNAQTNIYASPRARDYINRFGEVHGTLMKPVLTLHTTSDPNVDVRSESSYRQTVGASACLGNLVQAYVAGVGHCAFTANQLLAALAALEGWLDTGVPPTASAFPEGLGFNNTFVPLPWPF